jgi:hypothetical protein
MMLKKQSLELNMKKILLLILAVPALLSFEAKAQLSVNTLTTTGLSEPYDVVEDASYNVYITDSANNRIIKLDGNNQSQSVLAGTTGSSGTNDGPAYAAQFNNPQGLLPVTIGGTAGLLVADSGNYLIRFVRLSDGYVTTLAGKAGLTGSTDNPIGTDATFTFPIGLTQDGNSNVYIVDSISSKIRVMNLNDPNFGVSSVIITGTRLNKPTAIAFMGTNQFWLADTLNNAVKLITLTSTTTGSLTTYMGSVTAGTSDNGYGPNARFNQPRGLLWDSSLGLLISDTGNNTLRLATNNPVYGVTNYAVITFAGTPGSAGLVDGVAGTAKFSSPYGLWKDDVNSYYLADGKNNAIRSLQYGTRDFTPVQTPVIGYATRVVDPISGIAIVLFNSDLPKIFNNIPNIQMTGASGTYIYYIIGSSSASIPDPTQFQTNNSVTPFINDSLTWPAPMIVSSQIIPNMTIKAIGAIPRGTGRRPISPVAYGQFTFVTATPANINPNTGDPQHIQLSSATTNNTTIYYTLDGSVPSANNTVNILTNGQMLRLDDTSFTNGSVTLKAVAHSGGFYDSQIFQSTFNQSNSVYDAYISFGFPSGEPHSSFIARPGQVFYAPVTLQLMPGFGEMYSLQFNTTVTNGLAYNVTNLLVYTNSTIIFTNDVALSTNNTVLTNKLVFRYVSTQPSVITNDWFYTNTVIVTNNGLAYTNTTPVTNELVYTNTRPLPPAIQNGAGIDFFSMLMSQVLPDEGMYFPPADVQCYLGIPPLIVGGATNVQSSLFVDNNNNLLGVGWLYRTGIKYKLVDTNGFTFLDFDTTKQDLITYSIAHDTLFSKASGTVVVGAYSFQVPPAATNGDQYFIQLGSPSATRDGVGAPGADVYIQAPANSQAVTVGSPSYLVGDAAPFRWLNAGDFGDTNLDNSDVMQVYQSAIQGVDMPPAHSDLFAAMDSCGNIGISNSATGYFTDGGSYLVAYPFTNTMTFNNLIVTNDLVTGPVGSSTNSTFAITNITVTQTTNIIVITTNIVFTYSNSIFMSSTTNYPVNNVTFNNNNLTVLFNGNDQTINQVAFGDGNLDVCDLYVTFRRSLDPSLFWFERYWTNNQFVAVTVPNYAFNRNTPHLLLTKAASTVTPKAASQTSYQQSSVSFSAGDAIKSAGQTVQIPIIANIFGNYPLRVLGLNLTVVPLDGSPAITQAVQFTPAAGLGQPTITASKFAANYNAAWLNSTISGLTGNTTIGTLTVTIPTTATSSSAYAIHFDHVSASPNGLAIFPKQTLTGLITLSSRTNSTYGDGIPDSWRLRWFGTANNLLSVSNACPTGDGINNWKKYVAGVDPNVANNFPSVNPKTPVPSGSTTAIHWPTVSGKQYAIERSASLFPGSWTTIITNTGTGTDMEFDDSPAGQTQFYRVRILP